MVMTLYKLQLVKKKNNKINKPQLGHFNKVNVAVGNGLWEWRLKNNEHKFSIGQKITIKSLLNIKKVDISGISKGKGFAGTIKRWNFHRQDTTHGNSLSHRAPGSIGQNQTPGRVLKGKKMAGQLGNHHITIQNLHVVDLDITNELLLIKGSVPGIKGTYLIIKPAIKQSSH